MEEDGAFLEPSDVGDQMPCELDWQSNCSDQWVFWSRRLKDELDYQRNITGDAPNFRYKRIVQERSKIKSILAESWDLTVCLTQFWAPVRVNGLKFLSTADQPFALSRKLDKRLCIYRRLCLNTLIPFEAENLLGRAFRSRLPEVCLDLQNYSLKEFPLLKDAIQLGVSGYCAWPVLDRHHYHSLGVFEFAFMGIPSLPCVPSSILRLWYKDDELVKLERWPHVAEVFKVSPCDEPGYSEIGQSHLSVQPLGGGETTEPNSLCHQSNLQNPSEEIIAHDDPTEYELEQPDVHLEQPNVELESMGDLMSNDLAEHNSLGERQLVEGELTDKESNFISLSTTNVPKIDLQKNNTIPRVEKDYGITRETLEQHFGKSLVDAAKDLHVSRSTLKRICREFDISRWPHPKTRKIYHGEASQGVSFQGAEPYVGDQQCPDRTGKINHCEASQGCAEPEPYAGDQQCPDLTGKPCDTVMTVKVTYRGDTVKFKLTPLSTRVELEGEVENRLNISLQRFSIKYQDEDDDWILITSDSDLREGMHSLRLLGRTTMKLLVTPKSDT